MNSVPLQVQKVHLLCEGDITELKHFLAKRNIQHTDKLVFSNLGHRMLYSDAFRYASEKLQHRNTVIMNSDCYLENGFEKLNPFILRKRVAYALSRHEPKRVSSCVRKGNDKCSDYHGSHDAFIFHLTQNLPEIFLKTVHISPNVLGAENVVIDHLKEYARFRVRNPCEILRVIHNHCSGYRTIRKPRLDRMLGVNAVAPPSWL